MLKQAWKPLKFVLLLILFLSTLAVGAQDERLRAEQFTTEDGLTSNIISSVVQDNLGYLWMRTEFGVARFDGYQFESFDYDPNNPQRPFQKVYVNNGLFMDQRGNIWLNYEGMGLSFYDYSIGQFRHFKPDPQLLEYIGNYDVNCFYSLSEDELLIGTDRGLFKYNYPDGQFTKYPFEIELPVRRIFPDNVGNIWIGTGFLRNYLNGFGAFLYETKSGVLHKIGKGGERINDIYQDTSGRIWLATNQGIGRVHEYSPGITDLSNAYYSIKRYELNDGLDAQRNNFDAIYEFNDQVWVSGNLGIARIMQTDGKDFAYKMYLASGAIDNNSSISFQRMMHDNSGNLWAISNNANYGLIRYYPETDRFDTNIEKGRDFEMNEGRLLSGFMGKDNILWLGTERYGLLKMDLEQKRFKTLKAVAGVEQPKVSNNIFSITPGRGDELWLGTAGGVVHYRKEQERFQVFNQSNTPMNGNVIYCSLVDSKGNLWLGHNPDQVSKINTNTWENYPFKYVIDDDTTGFYAWAISAIKEDQQGDVWIASHSGGIYLCSQGTRDCVNYKFIRDGQDLRLTTNTIDFDSQQRLWIGTTFGLYYLERESDQLVEFEAYEGEKKFREAITVISESSSGFWLGTQSGGLVNLNLEEGSIVRYTLKDGLPGNTINGILKETDNVLWLSTNHGISRFDIVNHSFTNYSIDDGLPTNNFNMNSAYKDQNGIMYFGSLDGVVYFNPEDIRPNPFPAIPIITGIQLFNREISVGDTINKQVVLEQPVPLLDKITLNHKNNIISFSFASMHFASPANNQYAYKLENLEEDWNYVDAQRRVASYTSLPHGEYLFRLKASNSDGAWSDEASMVIIVNPPFWNTNWFRAILLLLLILLTYALFRIRIRTIKARNITLKKLVAEKTAGLARQNNKIQKMADRLHEADQSKLKFFMNVSHEFRTPLTLILGPVSNLLKSPRLTSTEKEDVRLIERNGYRLLRLTNQLLDSTDLDRDTLKLQVAKSDIVAFIREIARAFEFRADNMDIDYRFEANVPTALGWFDGDKIEKILYNLISNALKFTRVRGKIRVKLAIENHQLRLEVVDNGIGIDQAKLDRVFERFYQVEETDRRRMGTGIGLNLAKKLAEKHKGTLNATSVVDQGTTFILTIPIGQEAYGPDEKAAEQVNVTDRAWQIQKLFASESRTDTEPVIRQAEMGIVLLVEDSVDMRAYLKNGLKSHFSVIEATNGKEGLKLAEEMVPDIIVSDVMMPKMDGMEFCMRIKENDLLNHIPLILLTAKVGEQNQMDGYQIGADDYLTKPIDLNLLRVRIYNLIKSRHELRSYFTSSAELVPDKLVNDRKDEIFLEKVVKIVEANLSDPSLNYQQFVDELGISKTRLYDKINKLSGLSINLFIRSIRLKIAARMIRDGAYNISEIAYKVGFSDPGYFSKCFKQQFKVPPKEYSDQQTSQLTIKS